MASIKYPGILREMLRYLEEFSTRMQELMTKNFVAAAMLSFPVVQPRIGNACLHFTEHGLLVSMGDRFSSKLISTWTTSPVLYDILTDDVIGPLEFSEETKGATYAFIKHKASLEMVAYSEAHAQLLRDHYAEVVNDVQITVC